MRKLQSVWDVAAAPSPDARRELLSAVPIPYASSPSPLRICAREAIAHLNSSSSQYIPAPIATNTSSEHAACVPIDTIAVNVL